MVQFSFDIVSDYDKAEMNNVFDQVKREMVTRYDFKNTPAGIDWLDADKTGFKLTGNSDLQLDAILEIIRKKLAARNLSQKILDISQETVVANLKSTKDVLFVSGLSQDKAKKLTSEIRLKYPKVKTSIQGEAVRVVGSSKDELQAVMQLMRTMELDFPISFTNYR